MAVIDATQSELLRALDAPSRVEVACAHCNLPVPAGLIEPKEHQQFCCEGCRTVYRMIHTCGLDDYYALRDAAGDEPVPAQPSTRKFEEFDDPAFAKLYCRTNPDGARTVELYVENVHCAACLWLIEKLPRIVPGGGVIESRLDFRRRIVYITWNPSAVALSRIARALASLGYPPRPARGAEARTLRQAEDRRFMIRIAVAGAIAGNVMLASFALYGGMFHGMEAQFEKLFIWVSFALTAVALAWPGAVFFRGAFGALRHKQLHMDVPVALGLAAGGLWGAICAFRGSGDVYFDSITVLIFLLLVGRWIQQRQQRRSEDAIELLFSLTPGSARVIEGNQSREVPIEALTAGQIVEVRAGESIPVDGVVARGESELNISLLTGESKPVSVHERDQVFAGATNVASVLHILVESTGQATRIGKLMRLLEDGARRRAPITRLADRIAGVFVVAVLILSAVTLALWWRLEPSKAVPSMMALLIVTCPCALGLATPLAIVNGIGRAARRGILIKGGDVVEKLNKPGIVLLDKTGTITEGRVTLHEWTGDDALRPIVAALERTSSHPVARALATGLQAGIVHNDCEVIARETTGGGVRGTVNGMSIAVGSKNFISRAGLQLPEWAECFEADVTQRGLSPVFVAREDIIVAAAAVGDPIRSEAKTVIRALRQGGWRVGIISGDHPQVVRAVAEELSLEHDMCRGSVSPEHKLSIVEEYASRGTTIMVGDGVNDAAALAAATVGVAVHGGAEASMAAADVYLSKGGLALLPELLDGSRKTFGVIRRNLALSLIYNVIGASLAVAGVLNPLIAALLMPASSLTVITSSCRTRAFRALEKEGES